MAKRIPTDIRIVRSKPGLAKSLWACLDSVAKEREYLLSIEAPSLERVQRFVMKMQDVGNPQFVAVKGGEVVGWADIRRLEQEALSHAGELGMGVRADVRGQGLGAELLSTCMDSAWAKNFVKVNLTVFASNTPAISLYKKLGFQQEGHLRRHACVEGVFKDSLIMSCLRPDLTDELKNGHSL